MKKQVSNLSIFEKHVSNLIRQLPADQSKVDIQDWLFRLVSGLIISCVALQVKLTVPPDTRYWQRIPVRQISQHSQQRCYGNSQDICMGFRGWNAHDRQKDTHGSIWLALPGAQL